MAHVHLSHGDDYINHRMDLGLSETDVRLMADMHSMGREGKWHSQPLRDDAFILIPDQYGVKVQYDTKSTLRPHLPHKLQLRPERANRLMLKRYNDKATLIPTLIRQSNDEEFKILVIMMVP